MFPRRVLVAPSGFKESLSAPEVAEAIAVGVRRVIPGVHVLQVPIADGGEGTAATLAEATGGRVLPVEVTGPTGQPVASHIALLGGAAQGTAVVEMAAAAGLSLVPRDHRDPTLTTTYGVGELILAALDAGAQRILVGCGDSGTCDGGAGALQALGASITDANGSELPRGGAHLVHAARLDLSGVDARVLETPMTLACNPHNVLTGSRGVARVFGPQKGATPEQVDQLAEGLDRWAELLGQEAVSSATTSDFRTGLGTGASGGLGAGLAAIGATLESRFTALLDSGLAGIDLDELISGTDLVITAEGAIDFQTPRGKVPAEVAQRAARTGVPVLAIAGSLGEGAQDVHDVGIGAIASIIPVPMPLEDAKERGGELLSAATERSLRMMALGAAVEARMTQKRAAARN
ncbi:glycerate kinase [Falsarthrobacter nasiphocae]|uniref:Glycerate kinase n=1 Tax=Falsarthrobacter nasiphocae TaxID=189863 RepID=A0AAE4C658_9MICC|nr:glycerate kinase [Falsarthrobacter nasiphocae]MDR6891757.1 glycerate kinase [Falsarthrobacter nasiphocae]